MGVVASEFVVGRVEELAAVDRFLEASESRSLVLEGEPGIGKTTLWREGVRRAAARGFTLLVAEEVEAEAKLPFAGVADLLAPVVHEIGSLPLPQRRALRVALFLDEAKAPVELRAVAAALLAVLRRCVEGSPVLVAVDNLQWLDPSSREALLFALRRVEPLRILFLTSARPAANIGLSRADVIAVLGLSVDAVDRLLRSALGLQLTRPTLARLHAASAGNPFYALELGRALVEAGGDRPGEPIHVPDDAGSLLRNRLRGLPVDAEAAVLAAALIGRPTRNLVERVASAEGLRAAVDAGIVERRRGVIAFLHPLLASAAASDAAPDELRTLHRRIAELSSDRSERARHLALAAAGPDATVAEEVEQAAKAIRARGAVLDAAVLAERALVLTPAGHEPDRVRRGLLCAQYLFEGGDAHRAAEVAASVYADAAQGDERARVLLTLGHARAEADDPVAAIEDFRSGLDEPAITEETEARLLCFVGAYLSQVGRWAEARDYFLRAIPRARAAGSGGTLASALALRDFVEFCAGISDDFAGFEEAIELERAGAVVWWDWSPRLLYATCLAFTPRHADGLALFEEVVAEVRAAADPSLAAVLGAVAHALIHAGELEPAAAYAREGFEEAVRDGRDAAAAVFPCLFTMIAAMRGDVDEARRAAADATARAKQSDQTRHVHTILASIGELELSLGDPETALTTLAPSLRIWREEGGAFPIFRAVPLAGQILVDLGRVAEAHAVTADWLAAARRAPTPDTLPLAHWTAAAIGAADGDDATAETAFVAAADAARAARMQFVLARVLLAHGSILRRRRRLRDARVLLKEALDLFDRIGAPVWASNARDELDRLGGRHANPGKLTPTEQRIAKLVALGRSNHDVASELFISPKTVEWNLSKIYRKLMVRSRTELAAKLARRSG